MARILSIGFELQSVTSGVECETVTGAPTIETTIKRGAGLASLKVNNPLVGGTFIQHPFATADGNGPFFFRTYFQMTVAPDAETTIMSVGAVAGQQGGLITVDNTKTLHMWINDHATLIGGTAVIALNQWYRLELKYDKSPAGGSQVCQASLDGFIFSSTTTATLTFAASYINLGGNLEGDGATIGTWYFDDAAVNDGTGTQQTSYPNVGSIVHLHPAAAGDNAGWASGAGGTANWNRVSEITPDNATTYNKRIATGTLIDDHKVGSWPGAPSDAIKLVHVGCVDGSTSATATNRNGVLRLKSASAGTVTSSAAFGWNKNGWGTNGNGAAQGGQYRITSYTDPTTGLQWAITGTNSLANMQIGYNNNESSTTEIRISTLWALVEYVPATVGKAIAILQAANRANTY